MYVRCLRVLQLEQTDPRGIRIRAEKGQATLHVFVHLHARDDNTGSVGIHWRVAGPAPCSSTSRAQTQGASNPATQGPAHKTEGRPRAHTAEGRDIRFLVGPRQ
jgi:hypothetical protein